MQSDLTVLSFMRRCGLQAITPSANPLKSMRRLNPRWPPSYTVSITGQETSWPRSRPERLPRERTCESSECGEVPTKEVSTQFDEVPRPKLDGSRREKNSRRTDEPTRLARQEKERERDFRALKERIAVLKATMVAAEAAEVIADSSPVPSPAESRDTEVTLNAHEKSELAIEIAEARARLMRDEG